jgi:hypothetical protein
MDGRVSRNGEESTGTNEQILALNSLKSPNFTAIGWVEQ